MSASPSGLVERMLAERIGLDPSSVGEALIARGVHTRMAALGLRSKAEYDRALVERVDEVQALVEEVVVPESWFFRDDRPFEVLTGFARDAWLVDPTRQPLTALSLPCAGGEEPYSIAITLLEAGLSVGRFRVDGVDVSTRSLARAIAGVYGPNAFRGTGSPARSGYFREQNGAFTVDPMVRSCVRFHLGNLLDPDLFADHPPFDVVFCRNLLIYFDGEAKDAGVHGLETPRSSTTACCSSAMPTGSTLPEGSPFEPTGDRGAFAFRKVEARPKPSIEAPLIAPGEGPRGEGRGVVGWVSNEPRRNERKIRGSPVKRLDPHPESPLTSPGEGGRPPKVEAPFRWLLERASKSGRLWAGTTRRPRWSKVCNPGRCGPALGRISCSA